MNQFDTFLFDLGDWIERNLLVFIFGMVLLVFIYFPIKFGRFIWKCLFIDSFWNDWNEERRQRRAWEAAHRSTGDGSSDKSREEYEEGKRSRKRDEQWNRDLERSSRQTYEADRENAARGPGGGH